MSLTIPLAQLPTNGDGTLPEGAPSDPGDSGNTEPSTSSAAELPLTKDEIQTKPWKYIGYKGFSQWMGSDIDFFVIRRFDNLNARVILAMQWELTDLEYQINALDDKYSLRSSPDANNGTLRWDCPERTKLLWDIQKKLKEYSRMSRPLL
jgi:hypothetical protein